MSRADRLMNDRNWPHSSMACDDGWHRWQPVSFRFETQLLDKDGRVQIRQPDLREGRVYVVCMECFTHTYVETDGQATTSAGRRVSPSQSLPPWTGQYETRRTSDVRGFHGTPMAPYQPGFTWPEGICGKGESAPSSCRAASARSVPDPESLLCTLDPGHEGDQLPQTL